MPKIARHQSKHRVSQNQAGIATIFLIIGVFMVLGMTVLFLLNSGSKPQDKTGTGSTASTKDGSTTTDTAKTSTGQSKPQDLKGAPVLTNYVQFKNATYRFIVDYPGIWGDAQSVGNNATSVSRYQTPELDSTLGTGKLSETFAANVYPGDKFTTLLTATGPRIIPKTAADGSTTWFNTTAKDSTTASSIQQDVPSFKNDHGVTLFNVSWDTDTELRGHWVFRSGTNYVILVMPTGNMKDGSKITDTFKKTYRDLTYNILKSVELFN